ncbi:MAG: hypothetical protein ACYTG0_14440 [Planctomycetota bacterium]|jgi:hypothetical protein
MSRDVNRANVPTRIDRAAAAMTCVFGLAAVVAAEPEDSPANLAVNPSFEMPAEGAELPEPWRGSREVYSGDRQVCHTGAASLKYVNGDPARYSLASQQIPLRSGRKYRFSAWAKTEEITGPDSGATICLEWRGRDGQWLGGSYPSGVKGTCDWTRVVGVVRVPDDARSFTVTCYVRKGMTGTAWFDDVEVVRVIDPPMRTILLSPAYRGRITAEGPKKGRARVRLDLTDTDHRPQDLRIKAALTKDVDVDVVWEAEVRPGGKANGPIDLTFPTGELATGRYELSLRLIGPEGTELQNTAHRLDRVTDEFQPRCTIDAHRRLLVDGEPFFPIGMYFSGINEEDLALYSQSSFNCLMPYGSPQKEQMDLATEHGLKVIYSIKDWYAGSKYCPPSIRTVEDEERHVRARVRQFRDHPALLAWYLNDELSQQYMPQLEAHQRWVVEEDPHHPTWVVLYQFREVAAYLNTFDVIGTDPYPIGRSPASMAAQWTAETVRQVEGSRPLWQVPQAHNWANYRKTESEPGRYRTPTFDEKRSMAWQCICEGATGLIFYSWYDVKRNRDVSFEKQWDDLKQITAEVDALAPVLLSIEPVPQVDVRLENASPKAASWLNWCVRSHGGKLYLFAANNGDGEGHVIFTLPVPPGRVHVWNEDRSIDVEGAAFRDELKTLSVKVYQIELASRR